MKGSRLELRDLVFGGVVTVDTAAGPKRVLKFSAAAVTIRDLKMAVRPHHHVRREPDGHRELVVPGIHGYGTPR